MARDIVAWPGPGWPDAEDGNSDHAMLWRAYLAAGEYIALVRYRSTPQPWRLGSGGVAWPPEGMNPYAAAGAPPSPPQVLSVPRAAQSAAWAIIGHPISPPPGGWLGDALRAMSSDDSAWPSSFHHRSEWAFCRAIWIAWSFRVVGFDGGIFSSVAAPDDDARLVDWAIDGFAAAIGWLVVPQGLTREEAATVPARRAAEQAKVIAAAEGWPDVQRLRRAMRLGMLVRATGLGTRGVASRLGIDDRRLRRMIGRGAGLAPDDPLFERVQKLARLDPAAPRP